MKAYIIIGKPNTRKSSILRCLAGCFGKTQRDIAFLDGSVHPVYTTVSSLQEGQITAQQFIEDATESQCTHTIFCLWPDANKQDIEKYPGAKAYIEEFQAAGWEIEKIAVLGAEATIQCLQECGHETMEYFPNSRTAPLNKTAKAVREHFGWV